MESEIKLLFLQDKLCSLCNNEKPTCVYVDIPVTIMYKPFIELADQTCWTQSLHS